MLLDQTVFAPMSLAVFLSYMAALDSAAAPASPSDHRAAKEVNAPVGKTDRGAGAEGGGGGAEKEPVKNDGTVIGNVRERMSTVFWPILARGYTVWPVVQTLNFALVPPHHRVLVVNTIALGK